jgi:hypothetical protein
LAAPPENTYGASVKKWIAMALLALTQTGHAFFETLSFADGTVFTNVFVTRVEPDGLSYMHDQGVTKVFFHELSEEIRQRYHYDPVLAVTYWYYTRQAQQEWEQRQLEAARLEAEEHQKRLDDIKLREDALKSSSTARTRNLKLLHMIEDGSWLCRPFKYEKGGFTTGRAQYHKVFEEIQIIVEGLPDSMADQDEWRGRIYEVGIHQIKPESGAIRTFRKYRVIP